ncbi:TMV resistance protein N-like [Pyrus ussuriensis x Pyrus communis]|uniref:TMV resistance protein N-like n=1 Tax=Pyrus ussuriensis x Pyrus communis TaxID=2448454 RepID=A0A5N5FZ28_9ROSA|nr:TMV resistance protein N-like [Pyrus ussuriensis x Pyrus communis]
MLWKSWHEILTETKANVRNFLIYNFDDINESMDSYLNMLFSHWYKQWKSNLHKHSKLFNYPKFALEEGCPLELEDRANGWAWLCAHFQGPAYLTVGQRLGKYCRGIWHARQHATKALSSAQPRGQVTALTHEVADLRSKLTLIVEALGSSGICLPPGVVWPRHLRAHSLGAAP